MRLIDVDALIDFIDCGHLRNSLESCFSEHDVVGMLEARPTVDSVEVVRCKDCTFWTPKPGTWKSWGACSKVAERYTEDSESSMDCDTNYNDFCSYGERKEGAVMTNVEALECFESDCETCQFKGRDCKSCRTKVAISALRREIKN